MKQNTAPEMADTAWRLRRISRWYWLLLGAGALALWPDCMDRYLAPRFFFVSLVLLAGVVFFWKSMAKGGRLYLPDLLMLGWYGWNVMSILWAFNASEAIFYAQRCAILALSYAWLRWSWQEDLRAVLYRIVQVLAAIIALILAVQLYTAAREGGWNNEALYDHVSGVFGNKSLTADFLCLLLGLLIYAGAGRQKNRLHLALVLLTLCFMVLLQVRTVYLAAGLGAAVYGIGRSRLDAAFRQRYRRQLLALGIGVALLAAGLLGVQRYAPGALPERLNPLTYGSSLSANERRFVWYKTDLLNADHYWLGVGNGSWKLYFPSKNIQGGYRLQEQNIVFTRVHNDYLEVRAEMGMMGVLWFIALFLAPAAGVFWRLRQEKTAAVQHDGWMLLALLAAYGVIQYFDFPRERIELQVYLGLILALSAGLGGAVWRTRALRVSPVLARTSMVVAAALMAFNAWIGWRRIQGEIHTVRLLQAQAQRQYGVMLREARAAANPWYQYDDVALPLAYHEGTALFYLDEMEAAVRAFEKAYALNPWSFSVLNNYASALGQTGRNREAIPLLEKTVEINPKFDEGKLNLAYSWMELGRYDTALEWALRVDTIAQPGNEADRLKNRLTQERQAEFMKILKERMK
jgi:O-antigen ligase